MIWCFKNKTKGFTLLEILLVVGIISILAGIVIVAINPSKQLAAVRNTERKSDIKQINNAVTQYYIDHKIYPASITNTLTEICDTSVASPNCTGLIDLSDLVPDYVVNIPVDPKAVSPGTGYEIMKSNNGKKVVLVAPDTELETYAIAIGTSTVLASASESVPGGGGGGDTGNTGSSVDTLNIDWPGGGDVSDKRGVKILTKNASTLTKITKDGAVNATTAYLMDSGFNVLDSSSFSGNDATFSYSLNDATYYYIVVDSGGSSYTQVYNATPSYPVAGTNVDFVTGYLGGDTGEYYLMIESITTTR